MKQMIYMDYAAATPVDAQVAAVMQPYLSDKFYNPSATYLAAQQVKQDLEKARSNVAQVLGARPTEIVFTAGGTEANNLAIRGILEQFPTGHIVTSAIEHESVLEPSRHYQHTLAPVGLDSIVLIDELRSLITDKTVLVSIMYANNEVGAIQPIREIAKIVQSVRQHRQTKSSSLPIYLHVDAEQAANYLDLHVSRLGVDLMTLNGGKIYGPKASGVLFIATPVRLQPQITGGGQERAIRSGTENVAADIGFAKALEIAQIMRHVETQRLKALQELFIDLLETRLPAAIVNGSRKKRLPNNVHVTLPGQDNERLLFALDEAGILVAAGSACSASKEESSHVLRAMGLSDAQARASLRITLGRATTEQEVRQVVDSLSHLVV